MEVGLIDEAATSFGASWRDIDADGRPDLWLSNHDSKPALYLNKGGHFLNSTELIWDGAATLDTHGAAWADYDSDGDADLLQLSGGGSGKGKVANLFYENASGKFIEKAISNGLSLPKGRGRMPLWFDLDQDSDLDVLLINVHNANNEAPSALFTHESNGEFFNTGSALGFRGLPPTKFDKALKMIEQLASGQLSLPRYSIGTGHAQLVNLTPDKSLELLVFSWPLRSYDIVNGKLEEIPNTLQVPEGIEIQDAAAGDFDNDGVIDLFLAAGTKNLSGVLRVDDNLLGLRLIPSGQRDVEIDFKTTQLEKIEIYPPWTKTTNVRLGKNSLPVQQLNYLFDHDVPIARGKPEKLLDGGIHIYQDAHTQRWHVQKQGFLEEEIAISFYAESSIEELASNISESQVKDLSTLLLSSAKAKQFPAASPAHSVAAADFDNDMDLDLYVVRTDEIGNLQDVILLNQGNGQFEVQNLNAMGKWSGRGDSVTTVDYDGDGFVDVYVTNGLWPAPFPNRGGGHLLRNTSSTSLEREHNWIKMHFVGSQSNRDAIGTLVELYVGGVKQVRMVTGGVHSKSQNDRVVHFGLGEHKNADEITIHWPSGHTQILKSVSTNKLHTVIEPEIALQ